MNKINLNKLTSEELLELEKTIKEMKKMRRLYLQNSDLVTNESRDRLMINVIYESLKEKCGFKESTEDFLRRILEPVEGTVKFDNASELTYDAYKKLSKDIYQICNFTLGEYEVKKRGCSKVPTIQFEAWHPSYLAEEYEAMFSEILDIMQKYKRNKNTSYNSNKEN